MRNSENLLIQGFLIAQIGKNYSEEALKTKAVTGKDLLTLAYEMIDEVQKISAGSYVWVEYEDVDRLRDFYKDFGFTEIKDHLSENGLRMAILKIK
ncbi:putative GNAT family N-acyltransferase [Staphylococcus hominis]